MSYSRPQYRCKCGHGRIGPELAKGYLVDDVAKLLGPCPKCNEPVDSTFEAIRGEPVIAYGLQWTAGGTLP